MRRQGRGMGKKRFTAEEEGHLCHCQQHRKSAPIIGQEEIASAHPLVKPGEVGYVADEGTELGENGGGGEPWHTHRQNGSHHIAGIEISVVHMGQEEGDHQHGQGCEA